METILFIAIFILGTIIGSFLNVVILRYNTGKTLGGRSMCLYCSKTLKWRHLVPVFSYIFLWGRCAFCRVKVSMQYPIVEALTGLAFLLIAFKITFVPVLLLYLTAFSILLVIAVYDYRHKIIPDGLVFLFIVVSFLRILIDFGIGKGNFFQDFFSGLAMSAFFATLWWVSEGKWMGFGDAKLVLGIGWLLPFCQNISAVMLSFFVGSIVGIFIIFFTKLASYRKGKKLDFDREIPFAPFLIFSAFVALVFNFDVIGLMVAGVGVCLG